MDVERSRGTFFDDDIGVEGGGSGQYFASMSGRISRAGIARYFWRTHDATLNVCVCARAFNHINRFGRHKSNNTQRCPTAHAMLHCMESVSNSISLLTVDDDDDVAPRDRVVVRGHMWREASASPSPEPKPMLNSIFHGLMLNQHGAHRFIM